MGNCSIEVIIFRHEPIEWVAYDDWQGQLGTCELHAYPRTANKSQIQNVWRRKNIWHLQADKVVLLYIIRFIENVTRSNTLYIEHLPKVCHTAYPHCQQELQTRHIRRTFVAGADMIYIKQWWVVLNRDGVSIEVGGICIGRLSCQERG